MYIMSFGGSRRKHTTSSSLNLINKKPQQPNGPGSGIKGDDSVQVVGGGLYPAGEGMEHVIEQTATGLKLAGQGMSKALGPGEALHGPSAVPKRKKRVLDASIPQTMSPFAKQ